MNLGNLLSQEKHSKAIPHFVCLVSDQTYQHIPLLTHSQITLHYMQLLEHNMALETSVSG